MDGRKVERSGKQALVHRQSGNVCAHKSNRSLHNFRLNRGDVFPPRPPYAVCRSTARGCGVGAGSEGLSVKGGALCCAVSVKKAVQTCPGCVMDEAGLLSLIHVTRDSLRWSRGATVGDTEMEADPVGGGAATLESPGTEWQIERSDVAVDHMWAAFCFFYTNKSREHLFSSKERPRRAAPRR